MVRNCKANQFRTAPQIKNEILIEHGMQVSTPTTQRWLRARPFGRKTRSKPHLTPCHKQGFFQGAFVPLEIRGFISSTKEISMHDIYIYI